MQFMNKWRNMYFWHSFKGLLLHDIFLKLPLISTLWTIKWVAEVFYVGYIHENFVLYITPAVELPPPQKISRANLYQNVDTRKYDPKRRNSITFLCRNPKGGFHKNRCFHSVLYSKSIISWVQHSFSLKQLYYFASGKWQILFSPILSYE